MHTMGMIANKIPLLKPTTTRLQLQVVVLSSLAFSGSPADYHYHRRHSLRLSYPSRIPRKTHNSKLKINQYHQKEAQKKLTRSC